MPSEGRRGDDVATEKVSLIFNERQITPKHPKPAGFKSDAFYMNVISVLRD